MIQKVFKQVLCCVFVMWCIWQGEINKKTMQWFSPAMTATLSIPIEVVSSVNIYHNKIEFRIHIFCDGFTSSSREILNKCKCIITRLKIVDRLVLNSYNSWNSWYSWYSGLNPWDGRGRHSKTFWCRGLLVKRWTLFLALSGVLFASLVSRPVWNTITTLSVMGNVLSVHGNQPKHTE